MDCWSIFPEHLVEIFAEKLDSHIDFLSFGAVCTSWRSVFKNNIPRLPSKFPISYCLPKGKPLLLLVRQRQRMRDEKIHSLLSLSNEKMIKVSHELNLPEIENKCIRGSWRGWLFVVDYINALEASLINPLTRAKVCLPSFYSVSWYLVGLKNVVFSNPTGNKDECMVMFVSNYCNIYSCRVGDDKWNILKHSHGILDLINYNGLFYAIDTKSDLYRITMKEHTIDMEHILLWKIWRNPELCPKKFLVESSGELLLITHTIIVNLDGIPHFEIFRLACRPVFKHCRKDSLKTFVWEMVQDVGNQIIFLGDEGSRSVESSLYAGTKGNCIYFPHFIDDHLHMAVYSLTSRSIEYFSVNDAKKLIGAFWFFPNPW